MQIAIPKNKERNKAGRQCYQKLGIKPEEQKFLRHERSLSTLLYPMFGNCYTLHAQLAIPELFIYGNFGYILDELRN